MPVLQKLLSHPHSLRHALYHKMRSKLRGFHREHYLACVMRGAQEASAVGVPMAIAEFNDAHERRKIRSNLYWYHRPDPYVRGWKLYDFHHFDHPDYTKLTRTKKA